MYNIPVHKVMEILDTIRDNAKATLDDSHSAPAERILACEKISVCCTIVQEIAISLKKDVDDIQCAVLDASRS